MPAIAVIGTGKRIGKTAVCGHLARLLGERHRVVQVATNLMSNAHKYTHTGGTIEITASAQDAFVRVAVRDNGMGIPPEMLSRIFRMTAR